ncbi:hypothetical protein EHF33_09665 [Deinococcus psychrotolerans]|uniref:Uncharacterized protein n=1 Tax=Deinococcus psychrotolerans TaxID=2489213 RepID=A0A3G8YDB8_9DEIO|nr:hypothetical protein [Deinococcus psychrotolerans]AZI42975.1 hypothetical protein EHF33_09665 [Deinococcus psychrotolerans]
MEATHLHGAAMSILISAGFALGWGISGSLALPGNWRIPALILVVLVSLGLATVGFKFYRRAKQSPNQSASPAVNPFLTTPYRIAVTAMLIAFPVAGRLLTVSGHPDAIMPVIAILVGLHFLGLVPAFRSGTFVWVAGAFCLLGATALFLPVQLGSSPPIELRSAFVGLGCALILWLSVTPLALTTSRQVRSSSAN